jgi:lysophospholipase L1-like esterase
VPTAQIDTVLALGDSATVGFGTGGRPYPVVVGETLGAGRVEIDAALGRTTGDVLAAHGALVAEHRPDLVIVQTGMADSLLHPGRRVQQLLERFAPPTWHGVDGLERRAVYSGSRVRRVRQRAASGAKTTLKRTIVGVTGGHTRLGPEESADRLDRLLGELTARCPVVVSIGFYTIDEHFFPGQERTNRRFRAARAEVLARHPAVLAVDVDRVLRRWEHFLADHGHWNAEGHAAVAAEIMRSLAAAHPGLVPAATGTTR